MERWIAQAKDIGDLKECTHYAELREPQPSGEGGVVP